MSASPTMKASRTLPRADGTSSKSTGKTATAAHSAPIESLLANYAVKDILKVRMKDLDLKNTDLQIALGYPRPNVIAMMRVGGMRLPASKAVITAKLLQIDPKFLLGKVIAENDRELWTEMSAVMNTALVTDHEIALICMVREAMAGYDLNMAECQEFKQVALPVMRKQAERAAALVKAALHRVDD